MTGSVWALLGFAVLAAVGTTIGGVLPLGFDPTRRVRGTLLAVAAGVLLGVVCMEIWPEVSELDQAGFTIAGLAAGASVMVGVDSVTRRLEAKNEGRMPIGLVAASGIDSLVDGALIGIGYAADPATGILLSVAVALEKCAMTLSLGAELRNAGRSGKTVVSIVAGVAFALVPAALVGFLLLRDPAPAVLAFILSAAGAAILYLVTTELLPRGRDAHASPTTTACFFGGFVGIAAFEMVVMA